MLRPGITPFEEEQEREEHPLFSKAAQARLRALEASDIWQWLRKGIESQREALLSTSLHPGESLKERWGAIQQLSLLLHGGPQMILQQAQVAEPRQDEVPEYVAKAHKFEGM
jgi:hypothetical protein